MTAKSRFYGPDNKPLDNGEDLKPLAVEVQALVKAEVNTAMDNARDALRREAKADRRSDSIKKWIRYGILLLINAIIGFLLWIYGPKEVREWTREFVKENMNKPTLAQAAQEVVSEKMDGFANQKLQPVVKSVEALQTGVKEAAQTLARLREEQLLIASVGRAEAFDRDAYRELEELARGTNQLAPLARATLSKVQRTLILDRANIVSLVPLERRGQTSFVGPYTSDELAIRLRQVPPDGAINIIGKEKYRLFVPELVTLARSKDLWTANRVSKALQEIVDVSFDPWDLTPLDTWWAENRSAFTNWPYEAYYQANADFGACQYGEALEGFTSVLSIDPAADRSRALAVACALEAGGLAVATNLNVGYVRKDGRWEQWARCKMILATGNVETATREFAKLTSAYPTFSDKAWISRGTHVLRQLDWGLYDKLIAEEKATSNKTIQAASQ